MYSYELSQDIINTIYFFVFVEVPFSDILVIKFYVFLTHSYILQVKKIKNIYVYNLGIHRVIMFLLCD